jgi:hypothetical protein
MRAIAATPANRPAETPRENEREKFMKKPLFFKAVSFEPLFSPMRAVEPRLHRRPLRGAGTRNKRDPAISTSFDPCCAPATPSATAWRGCEAVCELAALQQVG